MIESKVIIDRKEYVKVCEQLKELQNDIAMFKECKDDRCLQVMEQRIANMQNILLES